MWLPCPCPMCRSPTPRDTPEHAAALQLFIRTAAQELQQECEGLRHSQSASSRILAACGTTLLGRQQQRSAQQSSSSSSSSDPLACIPPSSRIRCWDLAPHVDLQLQVPPQQLLEHLLYICKLSRQQSLQQQPPRQPTPSNQDCQCSQDTHQHAASSSSSLQGILHHYLLDAAAFMSVVLPAPAMKGLAAPSTTQPGARALQQPPQQTSTTCSSSLSNSGSSSLSNRVSSSLSLRSILLPCKAA